VYVAKRRIRGSVERFTRAFVKLLSVSYPLMMFMDLFDGRKIVQFKPCLLELICAHAYTIRSLRSPR